MGKATDYFLLHRDEIKKRFELIKTKYPCEDLLLFGSVALGDDDDESDIDLAITLLPKADLAQVVHITQEMKQGFNFNIHVTTIPLAMKESFIESSKAVIL